MKKIFFVFAVFLFTALVACNNSEKKPGAVELTPQAQADSLEKEVMVGHNVAMPKSMKIPDLRKQIGRLIDSMGKLPAKAQEAAAPYKAKLESMNKELLAAYDSMENWMESFGGRLQEINKEAMKDSIAQRIKFFMEEKVKVNNVKEAVLESVKKADAFLKEKL
jgi:phage host-nuclease inhibitor protein Gam